MDGSDGATASQKTRETKRKLQLREAQRRLRQRKMDALKDATSEIETLRKQLAEAQETIVRLSHQNDSPDTNHMVTPGATSHQTSAGFQRTLGSTHGLDGQVNINGYAPGSTGLDRSLSPLSPGTLESFFPGASNDLLSLDTPDAFSLPRLNSMQTLTSARDSMSGISDHEAGQVWPLVDNVMSEIGLGYVAYMPLSAYADSPESPPAQLVRQPTPPPTHHNPIRGPSFAKRLWRRCAEMTLRILTDSKKHQALIERVFGAYFGHFSPAVVSKALTLALRKDEFGQLEYHNYPKFHFASRAQVVQDSGHGQSDQDDDPYMTPRDIENYLVWNGQLRQSLDSKGNLVTLPCHFDFQGNRWILEENRLIHILMQFSVCLGQGPAILASQVVIAAFQSMQRVSIRM
ncbi:hypothetical protein E4T39_04647 [Aureobasidium subglaciale]|nr:hypothetical protein E4T39_04647 [Aureobasidium subglaciale]